MRYGAAYKVCIPYDILCGLLFIRYVLSAVKIRKQHFVKSVGKAKRENQEIRLERGEFAMHVQSEVLIDNKFVSTTIEL